MGFVNLSAPTSIRPFYSGHMREEVEEVVEMRKRWRGSLTIIVSNFHFILDTEVSCAGERGWEGDCYTIINIDIHTSI